MRNMIDFHPIGHIAHAASCSLELVRNKGHFVPALNQALPKLVAVGLNPAKFGEAEVGADENAVFLVDLVEFLLTVVVGLGFCLG